MLGEGGKEREEDLTGKGFVRVPGCFLSGGKPRLSARGGVLLGFLSCFNDPFVLPTVTNLNIGERNLDRSLCLKKNSICGRQENMNMH